MKKTLKTFMLVLMSVSFLAFTSCTPKDEPTPDDPTPVNPTPDDPTPDDPTPPSGDSWAYLINETPHEAIVEGNTLTYGTHVYTVEGDFDFDGEVTWLLEDPTAYVTFTNIPSGYTEFEAVYNNLLGKSIQGTAAMIPMAIEIYARHAATGERCLNLLCKGSATVSEMVRILKTKFNYSPYSPQGDAYVQRYLPAVTLKDAAYNNGYNPSEPYTVEMCRSANAPSSYSFDAYGTVYYIYILAPGGWDSFQRAVDIFKPDNSEYYKVFQCPAVYTMCKIIQGTWQGLK